MVLSGIGRPRGSRGDLNLRSDPFATSAGQLIRSCAAPRRLRTVGYMLVSLKWLTGGADGGDHRDVRGAIRRSAARRQRRVGRQSVLGLKFVGSLGEFSERPSERTSDAVGQVPGRIGFARFDLTKSAHADSRRVGECLLRQVLLESA